MAQRSQSISDSTASSNHHQQRRQSLNERMGITPSPVATPIAWHKAMVYERVEFVSILHEWLQLSVFRHDVISVKEMERYYSVVGLPTQQEHVLCLHGKAARVREPLYLKLVRHIRHTMISDLDVDIRFGAHAGDRLPVGLRVVPLNETAHFRAARAWRRAFWAMRSGITKKIAETRALAQHRINASSSGAASSSAAKRLTALYRGNSTASSQHPSNAQVGPPPTVPQTTPSVLRPAVPMSTYHAECASTSLDLDRLTLNAPSLVVMWASWDAPSIEWLQNTLFYPTIAQEAAVNDDDPWVVAMRRYLFMPRKMTWESRTHHPTTFVLSGAKGNRPKPVSPPPAAAAGSGPLPAEGDDAPPLPLTSLCKRGNLVLVNVDSDQRVAEAALGDLMRRAHFWTSGDVSFSAVWCGAAGMQSTLAVDLDVHVLPLVVACDAPERSGAAPIIREVDNGTAAAERRRSSMRRATAGGGGAQMTDPEQLLRLGLPMWHDTPPTKRAELLDVLSSAIAASDAPLVLESTVSTIYPPTSEHVGAFGDTAVAYATESDLAAHGVRHSTLSLRGACCRLVVAPPPVHDALVHVAHHVRNAQVQVQVFPPTTSMAIDFDAMTAELRVKGAYYNVTCTHCGRSVRTEKEAHYRCLHCPPKRCAICPTCYENRLHASHHISVKLRPDTASLAIAIWGPSNVSTLPTMHGKVLMSLADLHHDVVCNGCKRLIEGARWKCCCCHEYELCGRCESVWWRALLASHQEANPIAAPALVPAPPHHRGDGRGAPPGGKIGQHGAVHSPMQPAATKRSAAIRGVVPSLDAAVDHPFTHYMLHIRAAVVGDANGFLHPSMDRLDVSSGATAFSRSRVGSAQDVALQLPASDAAGGV